MRGSCPTDHVVLISLRDSYYPFHFVCPHLAIPVQGHVSGVKNEKIFLAPKDSILMQLTQLKRDLTVTNRYHGFRLDKFCSF